MPLVLALRFPALLFAMAVVLFGLHAAEEEAHLRYRAIRARTKAECAAHRLHGAREVDPCVTAFVAGPKAVPTIREGQEAMLYARAALAQGKGEHALPALERAVDAAGRLDRMGTLMGDAAATRLVAEVLDVVQGHQGDLDPARTLAVLGRARITEAVDPLASERLYRASFLLETPAALPLGRWLGEAYVADAVAQHELALDEMSRAAREGDLSRCHRAADGNRANPAFGMDHLLCKNAVAAVETQRRLEAVRAGLARAAHG